MFELVVAKYNEDIEWLNNVPDDCAVTIYNKSGQPINAPNATVYDLPNIGRESQTFFYHMLANYKPHKYEYTVFTQADPFEHSPDFLELLYLREYWKPIQPLSWCYFTDHKLPPLDLLIQDEKDFIKGKRIRSELYSLYTWAPISHIDVGAIGIGFNYLKVNDLNPGLNICSHFLNQCKLFDLADRAKEFLIGKFSYGAIFAVSDDILYNFTKNNRDSISEMMLLTAKSKVYGYMFERLWLHILGEDFVNI